jgi:hypothetical protein
MKTDHIGVELVKEYGGVSRNVKENEKYQHLTGDGHHDLSADCRGGEHG